MPGRRKSLEEAQLTGAVRKNPQRYRDRAQPKPQGPLGEPPSHLNAAEAQAWRNFKSEWPWLSVEDTAMIASLAKMRAEMADASMPKTAAMFTAYRLAISECGGTPTSRSKVRTKVDDGGYDPFEAFGTAH